MLNKLLNNRILAYSILAFVIVYLGIGATYVLKNEDICTTVVCQVETVFTWPADYQLVAYTFKIPVFEKRRICPDQWYENRMPTNIPPYPQYLIVNGDRAEIKDFDIEWIQKNCEVTAPQPVS